MPDSIGQLQRQPCPGIAGERGTPSQECADQRYLLGGYGSHVPGGIIVRGPVQRWWHGRQIRSGTVFGLDDDDGAGSQIAEPLVEGRQKDGGGAHKIRTRQEIDESQQIAYQHPQLARRLPC